MTKVPHTDLALLIDAMIRTRSRMRTVFEPVGAAAGLPDIELTVLTAVVGAATPPTVPQIGRSLGHPRQVIQRAANQLVARGLIVWAENPDHKRAMLLVATAPGRAIQALANDRAGQIVGKLMQHIEADDVRTATSLLNRIRGKIESFSRETER